MRRDLAAFEEEGGSDGGDVGHGHLVVLVLFQVRQQVPDAEVEGVGSRGAQSSRLLVRMDAPEKQEVRSMSAKSGKVVGLTTNLRSLAFVRL